MYKKLEKELHDKRKKMAEIIETANNAYEERDRANDNIDALRSKAKREAKDFENELKELSKLAEANRKAVESLRKDNQDRHHDRVESGELNMHNDRMSKNKSMKGLKSQAIDPQLQEKHYKLKLDYVKIEVATNIKSFKTLTDAFKKMEEENFEMFKYIIELSNQIEFLEHQITEYKEEITDFQGKGNSNTVMKNKHLKELDDLSLTCQNKSNFLEAKYSQAQKTLNSITTLVEKIFHEVECDKAEANRICGTEGVGESNLLTYLGLIERRLKKVLQYHQPSVRDVASSDPSASTDLTSTSSRPRSTEPTL